MTRQGVRENTDSLYFFQFERRAKRYEYFINT